MSVDNQEIGELIDSWHKLDQAKSKPAAADTAGIPSSINNEAREKEIAALEKSFFRILMTVRTQKEYYKTDPFWNGQYEALRDKYQVLEKIAIVESGQEDLEKKKNKENAGTSKPKSPRKKKRNGKMSPKKQSAYSPSKSSLVSSSPTSDFVFVEEDQGEFVPELGTSQEDFSVSPTSHSTLDDEAKDNHEKETLKADVEIEERPPVGEQPSSRRASDTRTYNLEDIEDLPSEGEGEVTIKTEFEESREAEAVGDVLEEDLQRTQPKRERQTEMLIIGKQETHQDRTADIKQQMEDKREAEEETRVKPGREETETGDLFDGEGEPEEDNGNLTEEFILNNMAALAELSVELDDEFRVEQPNDQQEAFQKVVVDRLVEQQAEANAQVREEVVRRTAQEDAQLRASQETRYSKVTTELTRVLEAQEMIRQTQLASRNTQLSAFELAKIKTQEASAAAELHKRSRELCVALRRAR